MIKIFVSQLKVNFKIMLEFKILLFLLQILTSAFVANLFNILRIVKLIFLNPIKNFKLNNLIADYYTLIHSNVLFTIKALKLTIPSQ